ncbi:MAG TPA: ABC transporter ATP-binding protein [Candidatus Limnocylindrales bacterium]|nr:ABC transporter ATP-binding protein [Candidatus Limnocylindrales bacterium]
MPGPAITVEALEKSYGSVRAVDAISFEVGHGEIFGVVGPNGAGKTTTIECLEGLRVPDGGILRVLGLDPRRDGDALRQRIGAQLQQSALPPRLRVGEAMRLFASFYARPLEPFAVLENLGLADRRNVPYASLSGGQKQRLSIALALVGDPELVFFDELTSGLDPQARHATWDLVRGVREGGKTVFLSTHFMEEAERLCDRVLIIDAGRIVALDTPAALVVKGGAEQRISFGVDAMPDDVIATLRAIPAATRVHVAGERVEVYGSSDRLVAPILECLGEAHLAFHDLRTEGATLEDVFLALTGRAMRS